MSQRQQPFSNGSASSSSSSSPVTPFYPVFPTEGITTAAPSDSTDLFKRRLSEVAWSHSMEVSEEKRYKMANKRR